MRLLRRQNVTKVVTPKQLEDLIKDLLESPEHFGRAHFATKIIFSASKADGVKLRNSIFDWLERTHINGNGFPVDEGFDLNDTKEKKNLNELFDSFNEKDKKDED